MRFFADLQQRHLGPYGPRGSGFCSASPRLGGRELGLQLGHPGLCAGKMLRGARNGSPFGQGEELRAGEGKLRLGGGEGLPQAIGLGPGRIALGFRLARRLKLTRLS